MFNIESWEARNSQLKHTTTTRQQEAQETPPVAYAAEELTQVGQGGPSPVSHSSRHHGPIVQPLTGGMLTLLGNRFHLRAVWDFKDDKLS